eukprot:1159143-Pelagomonas_calceolata.AAC.9
MGGLIKVKERSQKKSVKIGLKRPGGKRREEQKGWACMEADSFKNMHATASEEVAWVAGGQR